MRMINPYKAGPLTRRVLLLAPRKEMPGEGLKLAVDKVAVAFQHMCMPGLAGLIQ